MRKVALFVLGSSCFIAGLLPSLSEAAIFETNAQRINADIASLSSGGSIVLSSALQGTVSSSILVWNPNVAVSCQPGSTINASASLNADLIDIKASGFSMNGCTINYNGSSHDAIAIFNSTPITNIRLTNNILNGNIGTDNSVSNVLISGNTIRCANGCVFGNGDASNFQVINNSISSSNNSAVAFHSTISGSQISNVSVSNNLFYEAGAFCVEIGAFGGSQPSGITVSNNNCQLVGPSGGGYSFDTVQAATVKDNLFNSNGNAVSIDAVEMVNGVGGQVTGNNLLGGSIAINRQSGTVVSGNAVVTRGTGLYIGGSVEDENSSSVQVRNNSFVCTACGATSKIIWIQSNAPGSAVNDTQIEGNILMGNRSGETGIFVENDNGSVSGTVVDGNQFSNISNCIYPSSNTGTTYLGNNNLNSCVNGYSSSNQGSLTVNIAFPAQPKCSARTAQQQSVASSASGVEDQIQTCSGSASGAYSWKTAQP